MHAGALLAALKHGIVFALQRLNGLGAVGKCAYVVLLSMWTMLCLPTTPVEVAAGFIFPLFSSTTMSILGKTCGSIGALFLGLMFAYDIFMVRAHSYSSSALLVLVFLARSTF